MIISISSGLEPRGSLQGRQHAVMLTESLYFMLARTKYKSKMMVKGITHVRIPLPSIGGQVGIVKKHATAGDVAERVVAHCLMNHL
jgi:hypothetical protein